MLEFVGEKWGMWWCALTTKLELVTNTDSLSVVEEVAEKLPNAFVSVILELRHDCGLS